MRTNASLMPSAFSTSQPPKVQINNGPRWPEMIESHREQHPLLCDNDVSDEEPCSRHYNAYHLRRNRSMNYRSRARNKVKGAAAIIIRWPDYWSTIFVYWWIGFTVAMIGFTIFIIYNNIITVNMFTNTKPTKYIQETNKTGTSQTTLKLQPEIFMHIVINHDEKVELGKYLSNIETLADNYLDFQYNFIIVLNDSIDTNKAWKVVDDAETNNEIALSSLWLSRDVVKNQKVYKNIKLNYVYLSDYISKSPLKNKWKRLPAHLLEFILRVTSIWEKGGIAFNPQTLITESTYTTYIEKLKQILQKFRKRKSGKYAKKYDSKNQILNHKEKIKKRVNNIRDIIDALANDDKINSFEQNLTEAENAVSKLVLRSGRELLTTEKSPEKLAQVDSNKTNNDSELVVSISPLNVKNNQTESNNLDDESHLSISVGKNNVNVSQEIQKTKYRFDSSSSLSKLSIVPLFLDFFFHDIYNNTSKIKNSTKITRDRKSAEYKTNVTDYRPVDGIKEVKGKEVKYNAIIVPSEENMQRKTEYINENNVPINEYENDTQMIIDLKGNIIATETPCHAFIGTIFSNAVHHASDETITDFIVKELTLFCNGLLSTCKGIDVILL